MQDLASTLLPLIAFAGIFWLLIIRPQGRRQRELRNMQGSLSVGDEVVLTSGIHGVVRGVDDDVAQVEIASGVTIRVARGAIGVVLPDDNDNDDVLPDTGAEEN